VQNLNQLQKILFVGISMKKFFLFIIFQEDLRWCLGFSFFLVHLTWNAPCPYGSTCGHGHVFEIPGPELDLGLH